jgi:hypothetical protein
LVSELVRRVVEMDPSHCFVSDESTLWDFHFDHDNTKYIRKIQELYEVDVSDLNPPNIAAIAERIQQRRAD